MTEIFLLDNTELNANWLQALRLIEEKGKEAERELEDMDEQDLKLLKEK